MSTLFTGSTNPRAPSAATVSEIVRQEWARSDTANHLTLIATSSWRSLGEGAYRDPEAVSGADCFIYRDGERYLFFLRAFPTTDVWIAEDSSLERLFVRVLVRSLTHNGGTPLAIEHGYRAAFMSAGMKLLDEEADVIERNVMDEFEALDVDDSGPAEERSVLRATPWAPEPMPAEVRPYLRERLAAACEPKAPTKAGV
jgi:hypothetical protein